MGRKLLENTWGVTVIDPVMHFSKDILLTKIQDSGSNFFFCSKDYAIPHLTPLEMCTLYNIFIEPFPRTQATI